jgi:hypothetical protein
MNTIQTEEIGIFYLQIHPTALIKQFTADTFPKNDKLMRERGREHMATFLFLSNTTSVPMNKAFLKKVKLR